MKKNLFVIATICALFSSCGKDNPKSSDPDPSPVKVVEKTIDFFLVSTSTQQTFIDQQFEVDLNGTKVSFKESEMTEVTDQATLKQIPTLSAAVEKAYRFIDGSKPSEPVKYLKYTIGTLKQGQKVNFSSRKAIIKSDRPSASDFNFLNGYILLADGKEASLTEVGYHLGVYNSEEKITTFFNILFKSFSLSYTCK